MKLIKILSLVALFATGLFAVNTSAYFTKAGSKKSFAKPISTLNDEELDIFMLGRSFFNIPWVESPSATTARDGLGPLFNANTCVNCHPNNALGSVYSKKGNISRSMVVRLSVPSDNSKNHTSIIYKNGFVPEPVYGAQVSLNGTKDVPFEAKLDIKYEDKEIIYPDGTKVILRKPSYKLIKLNYDSLLKDTIITVRKAPALVGLGLIEKITNEDILENVDENDLDEDGISGKANIVYSIENDNYTLGRYTYKASVPSVKHQSAAAFHNDMGLTTTLFPNDNCTKYQQACLDSPKARDKIDVPDLRLNAVAFYLTNLKVPLSKKKEVNGKKLFNEIGCVKCHISSFKTTNGLSAKVYTDFLLHDMGEELSDGRTEFKATKNEWKTAPLWGISSYKVAIGKNVDYLHDGRARSLEEAILWHGGEALNIKKRFMNLDINQREKILKFLGTL